LCPKVRAVKGFLTLDDPDGMCPKGKKCYKDDKGFEFYDDEDGNPVAVTDTFSKNANPMVFQLPSQCRKIS